MTTYTADGVDALTITGIEGDTLIGFTFNSDEIAGFVATIPEPSSYLLLLLGSSCIALKRKRR